MSLNNEMGTRLQAVYEVCDLPNLFVSEEVRQYALSLYDRELESMYSALYILPNNIDGEVGLEELIKCGVCNYDAWIREFMYKGEEFLALVIDGD